MPALLAALAEAEATNERLGAMVEWLCEVIVDAREACQRAEQIQPMGSPDWVESGIAMPQTALREVPHGPRPERTAHPSALDRVRQRAGPLPPPGPEAVRALHVDRHVCTSDADPIGGCVCAECGAPTESEPCATVRAPGREPVVSTDRGAVLVAPGDHPDRVPRRCMVPAADWLEL